MTEPASAFHVRFDHAEPATFRNPPDVMGQLTHELAQPLGAIESIAYYLRMVTPKEDERTQVQLHRIEDLVGSVNVALNDALHYLRETPANPQVVDLHALLAEALLERPPGTRPAFHLQQPEQPALVRVDAGQGRHLVRSLVNLFRGLADRCDEVFIRTSVAGAEVTFEFSAPGLETSREEVELMFLPFGKGFAAGSGLTLASARRIVESNGGRMSARSDSGRDLFLRGDFPVAV